MTPKEECEKVMNDLLPIGIKFLKKQRGQFYPFGAIMKMDGEIALMGFYDENEKPDPKEYLKNLKIACKKMADDGEIKVSGIVWNASVKSDSNSGKEEDAIIVSLEQAVLRSISHCMVSPCQSTYLIDWQGFFIELPRFAL